MNTTQTNNKPALNWTMVLFFTITPLVGIVGTLILALNHMIIGATLGLALVYICATAMTITSGYHRLFSHLSYKAHWSVRLFYALAGAAAYQGSILEWCSDHRVHHRYTDTPKDPYNIKQGFWYAHIGWIFYMDTSKRNFDNVKDLSADPIVAWQHRNIGKLGVLMGFISPMLIACSWGDPLGGLLIAGFLRMSVQHHLTWCINSVCHYFGEQPYGAISARDNWFTALLTFGEGYHNFHHKFPLDYRNGVRYFHYDPTKWLIQLLRVLGLAKDLKRVPQQKIIQYRMRMQKEKIAHRSADSETLVKQLTSLVEPAYNSVIEAIHKIEELEKSYKEHKQLKLQKKCSTHKSLGSSIKHARRLARKELRNSLSVWSEMLRQSRALIATSA